MDERDRAESLLGYRFANADLLTEALTHASYANRYGVRSYDRLEFLGDSVLGLAIAEALYGMQSKDADEGNMTRVKSSVVCQKTLTVAAKKLGLVGLIRYEGQTPSAEMKVLSDVYEALVGAIYADGGYEAARAFVMRTLGSELEYTLRSDTTDYKTRLQEFVQAKTHRASADMIVYRTVESIGADNGKIFTEAVYVCDKEIARASGHSRREAQKNAAKTAYEILSQNTERAFT